MPDPRIRGAATRRALDIQLGRATGAPARACWPGPGWHARASCAGSKPLPLSLTASCRPLVTRRQQYRHCARAAMARGIVHRLLRDAEQTQRRLVGHCLRHAVGFHFDPQRRRGVPPDRTPHAAPRPALDRRARTDAADTTARARPRSGAPGPGASAARVAAPDVRSSRPASMASRARRCVRSSCSSRARRRRSSSCAVSRRPLRPAASVSAFRRCVRCKSSAAINAACNRTTAIPARIALPVLLPQRMVGRKRTSAPGGSRDSRECPSAGARASRTSAPASERPGCRPTRVRSPAC